LLYKLNVKKGQRPGSTTASPDRAQKGRQKNCDKSKREQLPLCSRPLLATQQNKTKNMLVLFETPGKCKRYSNPNHPIADSKSDRKPALLSLSSTMMANSKTPIQCSIHSRTSKAPRKRIQIPKEK
jgi:hypothetical protein